MSRLTYAAVPLITGLLALGGCPSDDVPADTDNAATGTTGDPSTGLPPQTTVDPDSTTGADNTGSSSGGMVCEPACEAGQCCVPGAGCFAEPEPSCPDECGEQELCLCPEGSDPCDCEASCITCGTKDGSYDPCLEVDCPAGSACVTDDANEPTFGWCAVQGCGDNACACPLPPEGTSVTNACANFDGDDGGGSCFLDCNAGVCPDGMLCRPLGGQSVCVWGGENVGTDCCAANGSAGCDDPTCQDAVCAADPFCCSTEWDAICAAATPELCPELCGVVLDQYEDCVNLGSCDSGANQECIDTGTEFVGWCGTTGCADDTPCQPAPPTGNAPAVCSNVNGADVCVLDCSAKQDCPDGMFCLDDALCVFEQIGVGYGDCVDNPQITCRPSEDGCIVVDNKAGTAAACTRTGCAAATDCLDAPATGTSVVTCGDLGGGNTCYLDCANGETCPDGMTCTAAGAGMACLWDDQGFVLNEDFGSGSFRPGWTRINVDGLMPAAQTIQIDDAWVVGEFVTVGNPAATSTSFYDMAGVPADDWLISPQVSLGPASILSWVAASSDAANPDGYEVYISTTGPTIAEFTANAPIFTIAAEADAETPQMVDLAAAGFTNQDVYVAFRNNTTDGTLLSVDNVQITQ
ncbi:MAG: choice-of-anchor J domain-containing protein [Deltaproteobacteria bacterium]|nr:choice-of-anchor J domain-containing protein [Deltaproteobacteria bacterium]